MGAAGRDPVTIYWVPGTHDGDTAAALSAGHERANVVTATPDDVVESVNEVDCVVSGQTISDRTGIDLLASVRDVDAEVPFILYPSDPDAAAASDAITNGATEYLPGGTQGVSPAAVARRAVSAVEEHRRERAFEASERRYETMLDTVGDVVYTLDTDGTISWVNETTLRRTGYRREDVVGTHVTLVVDEDDVEAGTRLIEQLLATDRDRGTVEMDLITKDGDRIPCENHLALLQSADGQFQGTVGVMRDISERKHREQALEALHDTTRTMMTAERPEAVAQIASQTASDVLDMPLNGIFRYDEDEDALVSSVLDDLARELFGSSIRFERGAGLAWDVYETGEVKIFEDVSQEPDAYNDDTSARSEFILPLGEHGVMIVGSTEEEDFAESDVALAKVLAANVQAALTAAEREYDLRQRERELKRQNERLEEFASVVSHDLRNPLNVAQGRLELYEQTHDPVHVEKVETAHERMGEIIDEVLTLARKGRTVSELETVDLGEVARDAWATVAAPDAELIVDEPTVIEADPGRLQQLLENLFRNAIEHGGTDVAITVGQLPEDADATGFFVADDGPGIPPDKRPHVFESGFSTSDSGTGFGLAIVEQIVTAHDWSVTATESERGGARFEITGVDISH